MPFIGAEAFFATLDQERILSIKGAPGAGKTFMAFELAEYYLQRNYRLLANVKTVWNDKLTDGIEHAVLILDEGGRYLREWKYFGDMFQFPRKFDNYILIPSRKIPHADLSQFLVKPFIRFKVSVGIPATIWLYKFDDGDEISKGYFLHWFDPARVGVYDTYDLSYDPLEIITAYSEAIERRTAAYGRNKLSGVARTGTDSEEEAAFIERIRGTTERLITLQSKSRRK